MREKKSQGVISGWISWKGKEMVEIFDHKHKYLYGEIDDPFVSYGAWVEYNVVSAPDDHPKNCYKMAVNIDEDVRISEAPTNDEFSKNPMNVREFNKVNFFQYQNEGKQLTYKNSISRDFRNDAFKNDYYGEVILSRDAQNRLIQYQINTLDVMLNLIQSERYSGSGPHWEVTHFIHQGKMYSINGFLSIRGFVLRGPGGVVRDRRDVHIPPDALRPISYNGAPQPRRATQVQSTSSSDWDAPAPPQNPQNPQNPAPRELQSFGTSSGFGGDSAATETPQAPSQRGFGFRAPRESAFGRGGGAGVPRTEPARQGFGRSGPWFGAPEQTFGASEPILAGLGAPRTGFEAFGASEPVRSGFGGAGERSEGSRTVGRGLEAFGRGRTVGIPDESSDFEVPQRQQTPSGGSQAARRGSEASRPATQGFGRSGPWFGAPEQSFGASEPILAGLGAPRTGFEAFGASEPVRSGFGGAGERSEGSRPGFGRPDVPQRGSNPFRAPPAEAAPRAAIQGFGRSRPSFDTPELSFGASEPILAGLGAPRAERAGFGFTIQDVPPAPMPQIQRGFGFRAPPVAPDDNRRPSEGNGGFTRLNFGEMPSGARSGFESSEGSRTIGRDLGAFGRGGTVGMTDEISDFEIPQRQQTPSGGSQAARQASEASRPATQGFGRSQPSFGAPELSFSASEPILAGLGAPRTGFEAFGASEPVRSGFERPEGSRTIGRGLGASGQAGGRAEGSRTIGRSFGGFGGANGSRFGDSEATGARNGDSGASRPGFGASEGSRTVGRRFGGFGGAEERSEGSRPAGGTIGRSFGFGGATSGAARPRIGESNDADYIFGSPSADDRRRETSGAGIGASEGLGAARPSFGASESVRSGFGGAEGSIGRSGQRSEGSRTSFGALESVKSGSGGSGGAGKSIGAAGERSEGSRTSFEAPELARFGFGRSIGAARPSFGAPEPARTGFVGSGAFGRGAGGIPDDSSDFEIPQRQQITTGSLQTGRPESKASEASGAATQGIGGSGQSFGGSPTSRSRDNAVTDYIFGSPSPRKTERPERRIDAPGARSEASETPATRPIGRSTTSEASKPGFGASEPVRSGFGGAGGGSKGSRPGFGASEPARERSITPAPEPRRLSFGAPVGRSFGVSDPTNPVLYEDYVPIGNSTFDSDSVDLDISCGEESEPKNGVSRGSEAARPGFGDSPAPRDPIGARNGPSDAARSGIGASGEAGERSEGSRRSFGGNETPGFGSSGAPRPSFGGPEPARSGFGATGGSIGRAEQRSEGSRTIPRSFGGSAATEAAARPRIGGSNDADYIFGSPSPTRGTSGAGIGASGPTRTSFGGFGGAGERSEGSRPSFGAPEPVRSEFGGAGTMRRNFGGPEGGPGQGSEGSRPIRTSFGGPEPSMPGVGASGAARTSFGESIGGAREGSEGSRTIRTSFGAPEATGARPLSSCPALSSARAPTTVTRNPEANIQPAYQIQDSDDWSGSELAPITPAAELNNNTKKQKSERLFNDDTDDDDDWGSDSGAPPVRFMPPARRARSFGLPPAATKQGLSKFNSKF
ncbi:hypothetical protein L5515_002515 [Caenorhabditis briggsae]|uniref:Uncharacterized protein n=1 Tax=Caenorhabditis briggsae TaxID=6238 RepID=A0AAE9J555_CAEBR|nr:hypothetical protein L5515_002515 [Caenorhabditis briggsae]